MKQEANFTGFEVFTGMTIQKCILVCDTFQSLNYFGQELAK